MAITTKLMLRINKTLPSGEHPIMFRITENRNNYEVSTKVSSTKENWNKASQCVLDSHINHKSINALLNNIKVKSTFYFANVPDDRSPRVSEIKSLVEKLTGAVKTTPKLMLLEFFDSEVARLKSMERYGYAGVHIVTRSRLNKFMKEKDMNFEDIDVNFLRRFEDWLIKNNIAITTRSIDFRTFRTVWRNAMKEKICRENHYPFKDFSYSKYNAPKTKKRAISVEQINKIVELNLEDDKLINSRNYFLFSYYCRGLNFADLASLKWTNIRDGFINYVRAKTKEEFDFKLHPEALKILDYYRVLEGNSDAGYVFPILYKRHATVRSQRDRRLKILKRVNKDLKTMAGDAEIQKNLTTYVARHSYASALRIKGVSKEDIGKSLGHDSIKTTEIYLDEIGDPLFDDRINECI
ncbi:site-specific recombinase XerD [Mucilaginibacter gracilis]|uniref:Site-specific recombinase XerD n=1 Tax=Mucilaginibacter gracilis TaxID=423350 RepID=A0A495IWE0_9SPHI|nr:site-specific integrase [Mucilaginibacter gracilis]RKR81066.1 site-specific recombinase XerD [Mucilaginibacter gracilis]